MEQLHAIFFAEANELVEDLEKGLLQLEGDPTNMEAIAGVFRTMHTLKGSAGMFGFDSITSITHQLETVYDSVRNGKSSLTTEALKVTFETLDQLQKLLTDPQMKDPALQQSQAFLLKEIDKLNATGPAPSTTTISTAANQQSTAIATHLYYIAFYPRENILRNGTNTLYLVEDLLALGDGVALPFFKGLPSLDNLDPQQSYTCFEIVLETVKSEADIKDVFMFVQSECELDIRVFPVTNPALNDSLKQQIRKMHTLQEPVGFDALAALVAPEIKQKAISPVDSPAAGAQRGKGPGSSIRVPSERIDELMNLVSELVTTQAQFSTFSEKFESNEMASISENVEKITRRLRDNAFSMSLIPIESLVVRFQRLVRDLSNELKKEILFKTEGTDTEIDKSVVEKLTDPILHILRNSLDHAIENPDERVRKGKSRQGIILLKAYYSGANVVIEISDDGAGINLEKVRQKAVSKGLIEADAVLDKDEMINLIFMPGFSTAENVTGVSGRGVGMDVVRRNISDIRGEIEVTTEENAGTKFKITLPLTLSIIDGLLVRIGETDFILPLSTVNKCYEAETSTLANAFNQWITLDGQRTPFIFLRKDFNINHTAPALSQVIKIAHEGFHVGLAVDQIIGEYQAVLKPLGDLYHENDEFSGATILGDGSVALVIDPHRLIKKLVPKQQIDL